ncbi:MAG: molybdopterin-dependent oxidoreductase [Vannielia sp.]|uniref:molybdopterin-dependent oxidoreductase n=1 Tax=Vannielia sp. TaxID=2813045 RepID=UPI003B8D194C
MTRRPVHVVAHWGVYLAEPGVQAPVFLPFPDDPMPSSIGAAMAETLEGPCRIARPAIRRGWLDGDKGAARGDDSFVEVGWDEALDQTSAELARIRRVHGPEAIYAGSYGWASAGRFHHAQSQLRRFFDLFGGCTRSSDSYSYAAGEVILPHIVAPMARLLAEHTSWAAITEARSTVLALGGISLRNGQVNSGGVARHTQAADIDTALRAGVRIINVNPIRDSEALRDCEWMAIRPGTDIALMLGLAHTLVVEGLHAQDFLESHCTGFDRFLPYLTGASDGTPKDADWAAGITGLDAAQIRALARELALGSSIVAASWSLTRQENGEQIYWMVVVLAAMLGGIGLPGQGFALGLGAVNGVGALRRPLDFGRLPRPARGTGTAIPVARIADMLARPGESYRYNGTTAHYPDIRLIYWAGGNPFHHHQNLNRLRALWRRPDAVVVHEPHWTPLARHADIVLPATLSAERADIAGSPRDTHLFSTKPVRRPFGEARDDHAIFAGLAERLSSPNCPATLEAGFTEGLSPDDWLRRLYDDTRHRMAALGHDMPSYAQFSAAGVHAFPPPERPPTMLDAFREDPAGHPLATPSGKIELFSQTIADWALAGQPGHPIWAAPVEWAGAGQGTSCPLHLVTHQPARRLHSQLDHSSHSRAGKVAGRTPVVMHPDDAAARGLSDGDVVRVLNDRGACLGGLSVDPGIRPGVIAMETGAWLDPCDRDPTLCRNGNPNMLTADRPTSAIAQGPAALSCLVDVCDAGPDAQEPQAYLPPRIERR